MSETATSPPDLSSEEAVALYRLMLLARRFDEHALRMRLSGEIEGVIHPYTGQEAIAVGVCSVLGPADALASTHRGHGHCIAKGADPSRMMAELLGRRDGYCGGKGGSMHIADFDIGMLGANGIVAAGLPIATGAALAAQLSGEPTVAVSMFGEGAAGAGPLHESLNIAALWKLPLILVCENNGAAQSTPPEAGLGAASVASLADPYGMPNEIVDGNDVLAVRAAMWHAVEYARAGRGPSLIETRSFRMTGHAYRGAPVAEDRDERVIDEWRARDPIVAFRKVLLEHWACDQSALEALEQSIDRVMDDAIQSAFESPYPTPEDALSGMFAE